MRRLLAGALTGVLTAAVALGVAELAAAIIGPNSAPVIAVGDTAINLTPIPVKEFAIAHFGSHDKEALLAGIVVVLLAFAVLIGIAAVRRIGYGLAGLAIFAVIGAGAAIHLPAATATDVIPTLVGVLVGAGALIVLVRAVWAAVPAGPDLAPQDPEGAGVAAGTPDRRRFLMAGAGAAALAAVAGGAGDALLAVGMNGQPLPIAHGFPARMIVPGLYGYVSATKWVTKLTVTTFAQQKAYWTQRGYSAQAPIKTESRIDVPRPLSQVKAGRIAVAGVAWAPAKGIAGVEVNVDNGPWRKATLAAADGIDTWRQWMWAWDAKPGLHNLQVRATDNSGVTQTSQRAYPVPNGASGWDSVVVTVT